VLERFGRVRRRADLISETRKETSEGLANTFFIINDQDRRARGRWSRGRCGGHGRQRC